MFRRSASGRTRVMSGTRATVFRTWVANWSCALPAAPRAGLPTAACPRRPERRRDCQRLPTCFAFPVRWRPRFAASTGGDGCLVPHSMRATVDGTTCAASATSRCDMPDFARATGPGQSGDNKRLRKLVHTMAWLIGVLGADTSVGDDDLWVGTRPPSSVLARPRVKRWDLAGCAQYGYCASLPATSGVCGCICCALRARTTPRVGVDRGQSRRMRRADRDPLHTKARGPSPGHR